MCATPIVALVGAASIVRRRLPGLTLWRLVLRWLRLRRLLLRRRLSRRLRLILRRNRRILRLWLRARIATRPFRLRGRMALLLSDVRRGRHAEDRSSVARIDVTRDAPAAGIEHRIGLARDGPLAWPHRAPHPAPD